MWKDYEAEILTFSLSSKQMNCSHFMFGTPAKQELSEYVLMWCCLSTPVDCALGSKHGIFSLAQYWNEWESDKA